MSSRFASLEQVILDPAFPAVDVALRRGRHIDREDGDWYAFVTDAQDYLEPFYRRYGCELLTQSDGYFYLLPTGEQLHRRQLSTGEMLVGQTLALLFLDPSTVQSAGMVTHDQVLGRLGGIIGDRELAKALDPQRKRFDDERIIHEIIRTKVGVAVRRLADLGFIEMLDQHSIRLRSPLLRFADPVRGLQNAHLSMERLIEKGGIVDLSASDDSTQTGRNGLDATSDDNEDPGDGSDDEEEAET